MHKTLSTRTGIITSFLILAVNLLLVKTHVPENSPYNLTQFLLLFSGVFASCFLLYKYYTDILFPDAFTHCIKTVATTLTIVLIGNTLLFFLLRDQSTPAGQVNLILMKTIFSYSASGLLSSLFWSFIFNTFTKK